MAQRMSSSRPVDPGCVFCSPGTRDRVIARSGGYLALYDISPVVPGHVLIIPERHTAELAALSDHDMCGFFSFARRVTAFVVAQYRADGYDWTLQQGQAAGQSVFHLHLHVIPREPDDLDREWDEELQDCQAAARRTLTPGQAARIAARLRQQAAGAGL
jgi:bis(5'-adenosyl)-triphosphatase